MLKVEVVIRTRGLYMGTVEANFDGWKSILEQQITLNSVLRSPGAFEIHKYANRSIFWVDPKICFLGGGSSPDPKIWVWPKIFLGGHPAQPTLENFRHSSVSWLLWGMFSSQPCSVVTLEIFQYSQSNHETRLHVLLPKILFFWGGPKQPKCFGWPKILGHPKTITVQNS